MAPSVTLMRGADGGASCPVFYRNGQYKACGPAWLSTGKQLMTWLFEWNWLGYLWAFLVGFPLLMVAGMFFGEVVSMMKTGDGEQGADMVIGIMTIGMISSSLLLGLITIFVWDFKTALWLAGGCISLLALIFALAFFSMKLANRRRWY
jgi:hypothetical protein